jgi:hypothetical protein
MKEALYFKHSGSIRIDFVKSYEAVSTSQKNLYVEENHYLLSSIFN